MTPLGSLPSVEQLLQTQGARSLSRSYGRPLTVRAIRAALQGAREGLQTNLGGTAPATDAILDNTAGLLREWTETVLRPVINATGVILHTNLGRAPISKSALQAMLRIGADYSNLELDLGTGKRGTRAKDADSALQRLSGAEASLVVNNNAAAVLLVLAALATRRGVAIARSQLVEIGGGFRMPDVMRQSGAKLIEVGTTNKVRLSDYQEAFTNCSVVLRAHRSNFKMIGFTEEPEWKDIVEAAHRVAKIVVDDLGSGALLDTERFGLAHEPTVQESVAAGADVVCFSGDKLMGGPQAGLIVGQAEVVSRISRHPLARAVRADKFALAGTAATLMHYLRNEAEAEIPIWRMIAMPAEETERRAEAWARTLGAGKVQASTSTLGGGSLPGECLPTHVLALPTTHATTLLERLRQQEPPILGRAEKGSVLLDPRTVLEAQEEPLMAGLRKALMES